MVVERNAVNRFFELLPGYCHLDMEEMHFPGTPS